MYTSRILFEYSINALVSFKCFNLTLFLLLIKYWYLSSYGSLACKYILSMFCWLCIKFSNAFVFPVPEPPIINILYGWSGIYSQLRLCSFLFSFVYSSYLYDHFISLKVARSFLTKLQSWPHPSLWYFCCTYSLQSLVTQLFYLYCHSNIMIYFH